MNILFRQIVCVVVLVTLVLPVTSEADTDELDTKKEFVSQLQAIVDYLARYQINDTESLSSAELQQLVANGTSWIIHSQETNGHFKYEYAPYEGTYSDDDNIVRQAGTLYALGEVYRHQETKDAAVAKAIEQSVSYFESHIKEANHDGQKFRCTVDPRNGRNCRLGANSLVLLGLLSYLEGAPEKRAEYEDMVNDYVDFILAAKVAEAGMRDTYRIGVGWLERESPFSSGEALLALVRYYQFEPDDEVKQVADEMYRYLSAGEFNSGLYLWMMAALKDMNQLWPAEEFFVYTKEFTDWRLERSRVYRGSAYNLCAYSEGLASAYTVLEDYLAPLELAVYRAELSYWNQHHTFLQIHADSPYRLNNSAAGLRIQKIIDGALAGGGFLTAHDTPLQRIDFTQHCVSSYLQTLVDIEGGSL